MRNILIFLLSFCFIIYPTVSYANPYSPSKIAPMRKGQVAPFSGTLLDASATATIIVETQVQKERCLIETNKELDKQKAKSDLELANMKAAKEAAETRAKEIVELKNDQIKFLENETVKQAKKEKNTTAIVAGSIAGGVLAGVLLTVAAAFVVKEVRK